MNTHKENLYLPALCILVLAAAGCGSSVSSAGKAAQTNTSLSIDIMKDERIYWDPVIEEFRRRYPKVDVEICSYSAEEMKTTSTERQTELMAGQGKDIYLSIESCGFDFYKVQQAGVFTDLYPFFRKEQGFSEDHYLEGMFDLFERKEGCWIVPTQAIFSACVTTKTINEELPVPLNALENYQDFVKDKTYFTRQYPDKMDVPMESDTGEYNARWGVAIQDGWNRFDQLFQSDLWKTEQELTKRRRRVASGAVPMDWSSMEEFQEHLSQAMEEKNYLCLDAQIDQAFMMYCQLGGADGAVIAPVPDVDGNILVYSSACVAISQSSTNKENAFRLLQIMLEETYQKKNGGPVVKEYLTGDVWKETYGQETILIQGKTYPGADEKTIEALSESFRKGKMAGGLATDTKEKYRVCLEKYYEGEQSLETCAEEFLDYLELYGSE